MPRELFIDVNSRRHGVGQVWNEPDFECRQRYLLHSPSKPLDASSPEFTMLEDTIRGFGARISVREGGVVEVRLPINDQYGRVCREVARCYYLCLVRRAGQ